MGMPHLRDLDGFEAELEEGHRQIAERREATRKRSGNLIDPNRRAWLRQQVLKGVRRDR